MANSSAFVLKHWREAATLIIVAPSTSRSQSKLSFVLTNDGLGTRKDLRSSVKPSPKLKDFTQDYDVLMLKRSSKSKFMPSMYVFPGGVAAENDFSSDWLSLFRKIGEKFQNSLFRKLKMGSADSAPIFQRQRDPQFSQIPPEIAFRISAIRETFEESGVLIACPINGLKNPPLLDLSLNWTFSPSLGPSNSPVMKRWRERVNKNPNEFLTMCKELDVIPAVWTLYEWSDWLTPSAAEENKRRFDTIFFICCLDHQPMALEDEAETVNALWAQPSSLLTSYYQRELILGPPQTSEISRLLNFSSYVNLMNYVAQREPQRVERWLPIIYIWKDTTGSIMPGDELYPKDPKVSQTVRILKSEKTFEELCHDHPICHRNYSIGGPGGVMAVHCNIDPGRGQVAPISDLGITLKSKL